MMNGGEKMTTTPLDIQNMEFKSSFRGYNQSEVDSFLNRILVDYEKIYKENQIIKTEIKKLEEDLSRYQTIENNLSTTLVVAQKTADELKDNAHKEANLIVKEAELHAQEIIKEAQEKVHSKEQEFETLINEFKTYKLKILSFVENQYRMIKDEVAVAIEDVTEEQNID